jgi:hypothetical protein
MRKNNWTDDRDPGDEGRSEHGKALFWVTPGERIELVSPPPERTTLAGVVRRILRRGRR